MDLKFPLPEFEAFVRQVLEQWHIPGLSIAVVKDGRGILCTGFGFRDMARGLPVTGGTLFPIASCTKAFTALATMMLVEEGRLELDAPVRDYLPDFRLYDEIATQRITPRDLLCHRSGLPGYDMVWYGSHFSRQEIYRRLRYLEPTCDLRTMFQYQNLMYMVVGLLIERVSGQSWQNFVTERIFTPLGMSRSGFSTLLLQQDEDHSRPYFYQDGEIKEIPFFEADEGNSAMESAGGITSCANDLSRWLLMQLQDGVPAGTRLVSPEALRQTRQPQIFIEDPQEPARRGFTFTSYGLGWFLRSYQGQVMVSHDGIKDGFSSFIALLPDSGVGVALLSNADFSRTNFNYALSAIAYTIFDRLLDLKPTDWNSLEKTYYDKITQSSRVPSEQVARKEVPASHSSEAYLGDYTHPVYGVAAVRKTDQGLSLTINGKLTYPLKHCYYDIYEVVDERFNHAEKVSFATNQEGDIGGFSIRLEPTVKEAVFERVQWVMMK